ncbi:tRNA-splicing ligase RtcB-domain-containing protein [Fimicolochytrium jonesii]|uniref:tRNA-splicing ligase RtcB-domain-containing protein n=1 Tax=Fimicolochytrium jonesii TaxID=1396493 RepID=UPI0022FE09A4|nr:tRNA-splicing ligase RtcB-domain-containing protein [Fimicolochytrium jonesii]KAI8821255.1 tRNA-splicing ligase RtcB-domain-containing protein [Fimicolochytrium jonesii]
MPSIRVTIIDNTDRRKRTVLLLQSSGSSTALATQLHHGAKTKLRIKNPDRLIVLHTGAELTDEDGIAGYLRTDNKREKEIVVCGKGQQFVGQTSTAGETDERTRPNVSVIAEHSAVENDAIKQLYLTVERCPYINMAVGMPDLHLGNSSPVGCVFITSTEAIYPKLIGSDIGCGMSLFKLPSLLSTSKRIETPSLLAKQLINIDGPMENPPNLFEDSAAHSQTLGTIGKGNHFAEFLVVDEILDTDHATRMQISSSVAYLLIHSGSRSYGKAILEAAPPVLNSATDPQQFNEYIRQHDQACTWAQRNRELIATRLLDPLGLADTVEKLVDIFHNSVTSAEMAAERGWVHRKGAAPAVPGQPVVIPGSRGAYSYVVMPKDLDHTPNGTSQPRLPRILTCLIAARYNSLPSYTGFSLAHGAGRAVARTQSHHKINPKSDLTTTKLGSTVICMDKTLLLEEAPECYKDIDAVIEDLRPYVDVVARLRPIVTYKTMER